MKTSLAALVAIALNALVVACGTPEMHCIEGATEHCSCPGGGMGAMACLPSGSFGACMCSGDSGTDAGRCTPGTMQSCTCSDGMSSSRVCEPSGSYGSCACGTTSDGGDVTMPDTGVDVVPDDVVETGPVDASDTVDVPVLPDVVDVADVVTPDVVDVVDVAAPDVVDTGSPDVTECMPGTSRSCYSGPGGTQGVGACRGGTNFCDSTGSYAATCFGEVVPAAEICGNAVDEDCDGTADDGCAMDAGADVADVVSDTVDVATDVGTDTGPDVVAPMLAITAVSGSGQSALPNAQVAMPAVVRVTDRGSPASGVMVTFTGSAGAVAEPSSVTTDASGQATVALRVGRAPGAYMFSASVAGASPVSFTATATTPSVGMIYPLVNVYGTTGTDEATATVGSIAQISGVIAVAGASDGTAYLATTCHVLRIAPSGAMSVFAGSGCGSSSGDGGPATGAQFGGIGALAIDGAATKLYVLDLNRVRVVNIATGTISAYAGGGTVAGPGFGDGGPATSANISTPSAIAVGPSNALFIAQNDAAGTARVRRVDPATGVISTWYRPLSTDAITVDQINALAFDSTGQAFLGGAVLGVYGIGRRASATAPVVLIAGGPNATSTANGVPASNTSMQGVDALAFDAAGNLFYADVLSQRVRRIASHTLAVTTVAGNGTMGFSGDYGPAINAETNYAGAIAMVAGDLLLADRYNNALRAVARIGASAAPHARLSLSSGDGQTTQLDRLSSAPLAVQLVDEASMPLDGFPVAWSAVRPESVVVSPIGLTTSSGVSATSARVGLATGAYTFRASFDDLHGVAATGSPIVFTVNAVAPASGTIFSVFNADGAAGDPTMSVPGPATLGRTNSPVSVAYASDGTIYAGTGAMVVRISPQGYATRLFEDWTYSPADLALDESRGRLYVLGNGHVASVALATGLVTPFAGGGTMNPPGNGDGGPATSAYLDGALGVGVGPGGIVYVTQGGDSRIRRIDPSSGIITTWLDGMTSSPNFAGPEAIVFNGTDAYFSAAFYGGNCGIFLRTSAGALSAFAGAPYGSGSFAEGAAAPAALIPSVPVDLAADASGNLYYAADGPTGVYVRRIDASSNQVHTVAGAGSLGIEADYGPASAAMLYPYSLAFAPGGHLLIGDQSTLGIRIVW